jgi:tetratricopeptide (TPR) repeat protein
MDRKGITGRVFNTFHFGQYVTWTGYPERTVFVDGRANIPPDLLEKNKEIRHNPDALDELYQHFGFESLLLGYLTERPRTERLEETLDLSFAHPDWALVYWDDTAMLYLRRDGPYQGAVSQDEYRLVRPQASPAYFMNQILGKNRIAPLTAELERAHTETGSARSSFLLGLTYQAQNKHDEAIHLLRTSESDLPGSQRQSALTALGDSHKAMGRTEIALTFYRKALALGPSWRIHARMGQALLALGRTDRAVSELTRALELDASQVEVYHLLAQGHRELGDLGRAAEMEGRARRLKTAGAARRHFENGVRAYFERDYERAVQEYQKSIAVNPRVPIVHVNLGHAYLDWGKTGESSAAFEQALRLEPDHAKAHYGLALSHKSLGKYESALEHFTRYLEIEPEGNLSRSAKREIELLSSM